MKTSRLSTLTVQRWSLGDRWDVLRAPAVPGNDWGLTFPSDAYGKLFDLAFPEIVKNPWKTTDKGGHVTFFRQITESELVAVRAFVEALRPCVVIKDLTDASVALGYRARKSGSGDLERTEVGQLMRDAKPYGGTPSEQHRQAARELTKRLCAFVDSMPFCTVVDGFVAVPSSDPGKTFSLPRGFAGHLAKHTGKADLSAAVSKGKATRPLKNLSRTEKVEALVGSVTIEREKVVGKTLVVVDDLYQSGMTLNYIAEELRAAGAKTVFGLAAVKTLRSDDNVLRSASDGDMDDEGLF